MANRKMNARLEVSNAERYEELVKQRAEVLSALQRASQRCRHHKPVGLKIHDSCNYANFLQKLSVTLARFVTKPEVHDVGFRMFLPNPTMREVVGIMDMSMFIVTSLEDVKSRVEACGMEFPRYVEFFHPDFPD